MAPPFCVTEGVAAAAGSISITTLVGVTHVDDEREVCGVVGVDCRACADGLCPSACHRAFSGGATIHDFSPMYAATPQSSVSLPAQARLPAGGRSRPWQLSDA